MVTVAKQRPSTAFGRRLREVREAAGLTQAALAELVDVHPPEVSRLESGAVEPTWPTVLKLAEALGVATDAFRADGTDDDGQGGDQPDEPAARPSGKRK